MDHRARPGGRPHHGDADVNRSVDEATLIASEFYAWAEEVARQICELREITETTLDASPFAGDTVQKQWLVDAGYTKRRTFPQMTRPVTPDEATSLPGPREGVTIRRVETHDNGLPVAGDLHLVHEARAVLRGPLQLLPRELP